MNVLRRIEDVFVQLVRVLLLAFSVLALIGMAFWLWSHYKPKPGDATPAAQVALDWKSAKPDLKYLVDETARDLSDVADQPPMEKRLADPALRPSFQKADGLLRGFIYSDPAARKAVEKDNNGQGLAPINALLKGDATPSEADVQRQIKLREERENACCDGATRDTSAAAAEATAEPAAMRRVALVSGAAQAAAEEPEGDDWLNEPVDLAAQIHERAQAAESEHGAGAYAAFVQGLPAALEQVLGNDKLAAKLREQPAQQITSMLLLNYTLSFDRSAQRLRSEDLALGRWEFSGVETAFGAMLVTCLAMAAMVLVLIRMERHMRLMSQQSGNQS
ncbi:hypothetical protein GCM10010975_35360 [Comamonas phosphati]|nr:hypothetical protein GCM10010975_35360 [Comamonas phosphati]